MKLRTFAVKETLFGLASVLVLLVPTFAQQETDPSWYDPWASPNPVMARYVSHGVTHPVKLQAAKAQPIAATTVATHKKPVLHAVANPAPPMVATLRPVTAAVPKQ